MTTAAEQIAAAETARTEAIDAAQQRFRAAIDGPATEYVAATATARAELEAAEKLAHQVYAETVNAALTPPAP